VSLHAIMSTVLQCRLFIRKKWTALIKSCSIIDSFLQTADRNGCAPSTLLGMTGSPNSVTMRK